MKNIISVFLMILCLGTFIVPKQVFAMQTTETEQCCKTKSEKKDCCKNQKQNAENHCKDNCCSGCHTCSSCVSFAFVKNQKIHHKLRKELSKKTNFIYKSPVFSFYLKEIWQPPKIG